MGGRYPTPGKTPGPIIIVFDPEDFRRRFPHFGPKPRKRFPNRWRPPVPSFGKRFPAIIPSPLDKYAKPRFGPWGWIGAAALPILFGRGASPQWDNAGWRLCFNSGGGEMFSLGGATCDPPFWDGLNFQVPAGSRTDPMVVEPYHTSLWFGPPEFDGMRMVYREMWVREGTDENGDPWPEVEYPPGDRPGPGVAVEPNVNAPANPNQWPPFMPEPAYPFPQLPVPVPDFPPVTQAGPKPDEKPLLWPRDVPETGAPSLPVRVVPAVFQPPRGPTKEGKYQPNRVGWGRIAVRLLGVAGKVYGANTEIVDLVKAVYAALPAQLIAQQPDLPPSQVLGHMLGLIARHYREVDLQEAAYNIATNQIEDKAWGRYFGMLDKIQRQTNTSWANSFDREIGFVREALEDALKEARET